jgi:hypothetical protein
VSGWVSESKESTVRKKMVVVVWWDEDGTDKRDRETMIVCGEHWCFIILFLHSVVLLSLSLLLFLLSFDAAIACLLFLRRGETFTISFGFYFYNGLH